MATWTVTQLPTGEREVTYRRRRGDAPQPCGTANAEEPERMLVAWVVSRSDVGDIIVLGGAKYVCLASEWE